MGHFKFRGGAMKARMMKQQIPNAISRIVSLVIACLFFVAPAAAQPPRPFSIYVLGDSSADTGNRNRTWSLVNQVWRAPYGITYPGFPAGRASDGKISIDFFAELIEVTPPRAFASINASSNVLEFQHGVNFAVGGAGVFTNFGLFPNYTQQVDQLKGLIAANPLLSAPGMILDSMILFLNGGNDYTFFAVGNPNATVEDYFAFTERIVQGLEENLLSLYDTGFAKFAIGNLHPIGCLPQVAGVNASVCDTAFLPVNNYYNSLLHALISKLQATLPGTQFIELDMFKAVNLVIQHPQWFGFNNSLTACCQGTTPQHLCSDVDAGGNPLYTVCNQPKASFFWDYGHLTQAGWKAVSNLFYSSYNLTQFAPNMAFWINSFNFRSSHIQNKDPAALVQVISDVVQALAQTGCYTAILQAGNSTGALGYFPSFLSRSGPVTLFLPKDSAIFGAHPADFDWIARSAEHEWHARPADVDGHSSPAEIEWHSTSGGAEQHSHLPTASPELATQLALRQAVYGWWGAEELLKLESGHLLRTVAGTYLGVFVEGATIYLGAAQKDGGVPVSISAIVSVPDAVLIHGTESIIQ